VSAIYQVFATAPLDLGLLENLPGHEYPEPTGRGGLQLSMSALGVLKLLVQKSNAPEYLQTLRLKYDLGL